MSLLMVAADWIFTYPVPLPPSIILHHSLHVKTKPDPLPEVCCHQYKNMINQ